LDEKLAEYMHGENIAEVDDIDPDKFVRWIFPKLVKHRRPLYQALADKYGYTVESRDVEQVRDETDIVELITSTLDGRNSQDLSVKQA
jgi:hypothetical protein